MIDNAPIHETDIFGKPIPAQFGGELARRFLVPPFTTLNTRESWWQSRKNAWIKLGIQSEIGRSARTFNIGMNANPENNWKIEDNLGSGVSIFDPVLTELIYRWYTPDRGQIIDPFAGGSVRGIVAACLGRSYWGCDLAGDQIAANRTQTGVVPRGMPIPQWVVGDSRVMVDSAPMADAIISCPPYYDLETYSKSPDDLSNMSWDDFRDAYDTIISKCVEKLHDDRFAVFVVGDVRDDDGFFRGLPQFTVGCFRRAGMKLYNEAILINSVGSLAIRTDRQFVLSRKLGKSHQTILIFVRGDPRRATDAVTGLTLDQRREQSAKMAEQRSDTVTRWGDA